MTTRSVVGETSSLLRVVEERMRLKRELEESRKQQHKNKNKEPQDNLVVVPGLPDGCIFAINVWLPLESILASRFVCKTWYEIVNSPFFVEAHLQRSEIGLIYLASEGRSLPPSDLGKASGSSALKIDFSVESKVSELLSMPVHDWHLFNPLMSSRIKFLEIKDGKGTVKEYNATCMGRIRATCSGFIILEINMKRGGLVIMNPVTRELETIPLGTRPPHNLESYGFGFCYESSTYKLVHLFQDSFKYFDCEIMDIGSGSWRGVDGPPSGFFGNLKYEPVFAIGALHWVPHDNLNEYIVSMPLKGEKFQKIPLPNTAGIHDRILEMGGFLGFVTRYFVNQIDVWILRGLGGDGWAKQHSISVDFVRTMVPLYCAKVDGKLVFKCEDNNDLYVYDRHLQITRKIEVNKDCFSSAGCYFPHVNGLLSWRT